MDRSLPDTPIKLYQHPRSGHSHRVRLFLSLLEIPHEPILVDLLQREQRRPEFLAMNPFGQVPVIDDAGFVLADSNAILVYLARRYDTGRWLPQAPEATARVQRWLSAAAGLLVSGPALARLANVFGVPVNREQVEGQSRRLLSVMETTLAESAYLAAPAPTIADVALYTYTAHAPEGDIALDPYPHIRKWLARIEALPGFVPMERSPVGLFAGNGGASP